MMKSNWREIPVPELMKDLPRDPRGFPVPVIIMRDQDGKFLFTVNNMAVVARCVVQDLCGVCGKKLNGDSWLAGGHKSAFHERGVYNDTPIHHECGVYALQVCPYLVLSAYRSDQGAVQKLSELYGSTNLFFNRTQDPTKPAFFAFVKISRYQTNLGFVVPDRPFLDVEYWTGGEQITLAKARELLGLVADELKFLPKE
jgi:hypothetical protein